MEKNVGRASPFLPPVSDDVKTVAGAFEVEENEAESLRELDFGQYLRRERVLRGISKGEILRVTKVSPEYLDALEGNHHEELPPKAFVVGFLRVFSKYAGLDENEVVTRYLQEYAEHKGTTVVDDGYRAPKDQKTKVSFWKKNFAKILGAVGFVFFVTLILSPIIGR